MSETPRVPIAGLDAWEWANVAAEAERRTRFDEAVRSRHQSVNRAIAARRDDVPPPLRCVACGDVLTLHSKGIMTRRHTLVHLRCRIGRDR